MCVCVCSPSWNHHGILKYMQASAEPKWRKMETRKIAETYVVLSFNWSSTGHKQRVRYMGIQRTIRAARVVRNTDEPVCIRALANDKEYANNARILFPFTSSLIYICLQSISSAWWSIVFSVLFGKLCGVVVFVVVGHVGDGHQLRWRQPYSSHRIHVHCLCMYECVRSRCIFFARLIPLRWIAFAMWRFYAHSKCVI